MHAAAPDLAIVIVSWNTRDLLLACLDSLPAALDNLQADIWIVDNGSHDDSVAAVQAAFPQVQMIVNTLNVGFAAANNQAIERSSGRYILLLNSDTLPDAHAIAKLVRFADAHPAAGAVGLKILNPDRSFQASYSDFPSLTSELLNASGLGRRLYGAWYPSYGPTDSAWSRRVEVLPGACMLVRRSAVREVGLMDEQYFMYSEETDWCLRTQRAGWELWYTPSAHIVHYGGQSTHQVRVAMIQALYRSKVRFFQKHYGWPRALVLQALFVVLLRTKWLVESIVSLGVSRPRSAPLRWDDLTSPRVPER